MSTTTTTTSSSTEPPSVPAGKVGCLLCGGFISVQGGDRARFIDHMSNEHDAKTDCHDVLLALCVLDSRERGFIVKSSGPRLDEIGKGQSPNYSNSILTKLAPVSAPTTTQPPPNFRPRQPAPQHRRGAGASYRPMARQPRPQHMMPQAPPRVAAPPPVNVPSALKGNVSISISKVDVTRKCSMCSDTLPNPGALVEHMNTNHFTRLGGINIVSRSDHEAKKSEYQERATQQQVQVQTPSAYTIPKQSSNQWSSNRHSPAPLRQVTTSQVPRTIPNNIQRMSKSHSPAQGFRKRQSVEVVKCNVCAKTVEKSKLSVHKLSHAQDRKNEKVNMIRTNQKNKVEEGLKLEANMDRKAGLVEEVELIELEIDETEVNNMAKPTKTAVNSPLPHDGFKQGDKTSGGDIQCKMCDKKLASNMALKMHNNLKHPVKKEVDDAEMLLKEDEDKSKESDVKNEIDKMETLELLDNLVNFLNDA